MPKYRHEYAVSRQHENENLDGYCYLTYGGGAYLWGGPPTRALDRWCQRRALRRTPAHDVIGEVDDPPADVRLRSAKAVQGYVCNN